MTTKYEYRDDNRWQIRMYDELHDRSKTNQNVSFTFISKVKDCEDNITNNKYFSHQIYTLLKYSGNVIPNFH